MATYTVTSLSDDGSGGVTLREAIAAANAVGGADRIVFASGLSGTIDLALSIEISDSLTIEGGGDITVDGGNFSGAFVVSPEGDIDVTLAGMTIQNGAAPSGGGLFVAESFLGETADVTLIDMIFRDNIATGGEAGQGGGAVYLEAGSLLATGSTFTGNDAVRSGGHLFLEDGSMSIVDTLLQLGTADRSGGAIEIAGGSLVVTESTIAFNETGSAPGDGGAIHVTGFSDVVIEASTLIDNFASSEGGAIWAGALSVVEILNSVIRDNIAAGQGGGGIFNDGGDLVIASSDLIANDATGAAGSGGHVMSVGGSVSVDDVLFDDGRAVRAGGAMELVDAVVDVIESTFVANFAGGAPGNGGAIHAAGLTDLLVGGGLFEDNVADDEGGAIWLGDAGVMTILSTAFVGNEAASGAAIYSDGGPVFVGLGSGADPLPSGFEGNAAPDGAIVIDGGGPLELLASVFGADQAILGSSGRDTVEGGASDEVIDGRGGADLLLGGGGDDAILGGAGSDILSGGTGANALVGDEGADIFAFFAAADPGVSTILDFGDRDVIALEDRLFGQGGTGVNPRAVTFDIAQPAIERGIFRYDGNTGAITIDVDGFAGPEDGDVVAVLDGGGSINATDFLLF